MDAHIKSIKDKIYKLSNDINRYKEALEALQGICEHDWKYDGHGHNDDFYICNKCGAEEWR